MPTMNSFCLASTIPIRWFISGIAFLALVAIATPTTAQQQQPQQRVGFQPRVLEDETGSHKYTVFIPSGYTPTKKWPVILFLHGAGERGNDGILPTGFGIGPLIKARESNFPFLVVFPQNDDVRGRILTGWAPDSVSGKRALAILTQVEKDFSVDTQREILTGWSMGAYGTWQLAAADPARWLAVVTVSGGGDPALAEKLKDVPIWAFHGAKDNIVRCEPTRQMIEALKAAGGSPRYTELADAGHEVWINAYDDDRLYAWMLSPQSDPATLKPFTSRPLSANGQRVTGVPEPPFVPALEIPQAVYVRLGNEVFSMLGDAIPRMIPSDSLRGGLRPISEMTEAEGYSFDVSMTRIGYAAQLGRAAVKAYAPGRLNVQLGLSNVQITIGATQIEGSRHSASAGPIGIVIGHRRPAWLSFDVTPVVQDRKVRLQLVGSTFNIANDNWYVTAPNGVSVSGFGLKREMVSSALVRGLYGKKSTIEQQIRSVVPGIVAQLEKQLDLSAFDKAAAGSIWPLPVYQPRVRLWPADVSTDEQGVSLVMGVTVAAVEPSGPQRPVQTLPPAGLSAAAVPKTTRLQIGIAPVVLAPISELLVQADVARIHVADTPSQALARLSVPETLVEAIPDLKRYGANLQVSSELVLAGPIRIVDAPAAAAGAALRIPGVPVAQGGDDAVAVSAEKSPRRFAFELPRLQIAVAIKADPSAAQWTPCAEFDIALRQVASPQLVKPTSLTRAVILDYDATSQIEVKGRFVEGYQPDDQTLDVDKLKALFAAGWDEYVHGGKPAQMALADIDLGYAKLRALDAGWSSPNLYATFASHGVKLTNASDQPLVYETKGPYSGWGGPFSLTPGGTHDYPIHYPLLFRRRAGSGYQMFTLPVGTHSEFRDDAAAGVPALYQAREIPNPETNPVTTSEAKPEIR